ncbi:hypothetical protein OUZ56_001392 [Daphnia magna]|uniref:Uncharacterized protein n=1 Tax=Daphnia magna TaxID=35525 RepID=A0ABR0A2H6_9CRUS|nr:hypothetical protein OUZ56_001392 [Daphnia magna]
METTDEVNLLYKRRAYIGFWFRSSEQTSTAPELYFGPTKKGVAIVNGKIKFYENVKTNYLEAILFRFCNSSARSFKVLLLIDVTVFSSQGLT